MARMVAAQAEKGTKARRRRGLWGRNSRFGVGLALQSLNCPKVCGGRMAKVRPLVILLIVATTIALGDSWRAVGASNGANLSGSLATCGEQTCCDDDEPQPALDSTAVDTPLACCEHLGTCDCQCCRPLVGIVQLVVDQRRVKRSHHCQAQSRDQFDARRWPVQLQSSLRAPQRPPGAHTASLLGLSCLLIV